MPGVGLQCGAGHCDHVGVRRSGGREHAETERAARVPSNEPSARLAGAAVRGQPLVDRSARLPTRAALLRALFTRLSLIFTAL